MNEAEIGSRFDRSEIYYRSWLGDLTDDVDGVLADGRARFLALGPTLVYVDEPDHPMAFSLFSCAALLCLYLSLREREVDVHAFGGRMLKALADAVAAAASESTGAVSTTSAEQSEALRSSVSNLITAGERSRTDAQTGAFQFDVHWIDESTGHWAMKMSSCGICHLFGQHDAMNLVPYMCATDDVMSDAYGQGLARTGTIALGGSCCDFDYQSGRTTEPVADLFPERIRLIEKRAGGEPA
jgi:hypothetical protein